jgi:hypothetical protein
VDHYFSEDERIRNRPKKLFASLEVRRGLNLFFFGGPTGLGARGTGFVLYSKGARKTAAPAPIGPRARL